MASHVWIDIVSTALSMGEKFRSRGSLAWYRGHREASWQLKSTIHRYVERRTEGLQKPLNAQKQIALLRDECKSIYRNFKSEAWPLLAESERSDWGIVFAMQHFSLPTRLLDWTESFACAVFFAQLGRKPEDEASIWVLDPCALNQLSVVKTYGLIALDESDKPANVHVGRWHPGTLIDREGQLDSIAVAPIHTNPRMVQQRAKFTLMGDSFLPLDQQCGGELMREGQLRRLVLPPETFNDAEEFLEAAGVNAFTFFPDLQGLALKHRARVEANIRFANRVHPEAFLK